MDRVTKLRSYCDLCRAETDKTCPRCGRALCEEHMPDAGQRCIDCEESFRRQERRLVRRCLWSAAILSVIGCVLFTAGVHWYYAYHRGVEYVIFEGALLLYLSVIAVVFIIVITVGGLFRHVARRAFMVERRGDRGTQDRAAGGQTRGCRRAPPASG